MSNVISLHRPPPIDGKPPPHDPGAEAAVLTACMLTPDVAAHAMALAPPDDFYWASHRAIAETIAELVAEGQPTDMTSVGSRLHATGRMRVLGSAGFLIEMAEQVPAITSVDAYCRTVRELAAVRRLAEVLHRLVAECYEPIADVPAYMASVDGRIAEVTRLVVSGQAATALEATKEVARELTEAPRPAITTGMRHLDRCIRGWERKANYVIGARTGMGKTFLALQACLAAARVGEPVLYVSLEMPRAQLMRRMVCVDARLPLNSVTRREMTAAQWSRFTQSASELAQLPIRIVDTPATLLDIKAHVRREKPALVVVDHIGLVRPAQSQRRRDRHQEVAEVSKGLKAMAMELDVAVLTICQVGRDVAKAARRPTLSDLRESGDIEQDADTVLLVHRPGYYDLHATGAAAEEAELIVAKQRDGEAGVVLPMRWVASVPMFEEVAE